MVCWNKEKGKIKVMDYEIMKKQYQLITESNIMPSQYISYLMTLIEMEEDEQKKEEYQRMIEDLMNQTEFSQ